MTELIQLKQVGLTIQQKIVLRDIDLSVKKNEIVTIVGPNGAGKSTLLSLVLRLKKPTTGTVTHVERLRLGYVPQHVNRDYTMPVSVSEFVRLCKTKNDKHVIKDVFMALDLEHLEQSMLSHLSGGELRRVLFARALLNAPDLLVLDEPTAGVDMMGQEAFYHRLSGLRQQYGFSILMVSHDLHLVMSSTDRVICLNQHICCQGQPVDVISDSRYHSLFPQSTKPVQEGPGLAFYNHKHDHTHV